MTPSKPEPPVNAKQWREALRLTTLGWELALPIFGGVLAGYFLDRELATQPTFTLGLLALGLSASIYNLWRIIQKFDAEQKARADESARKDLP